MSFELSNHSLDILPTPEQLYQLAEIGWQQRERQVRTTLEALSLTDEQIQNRVQYVRGYPYNFNTTILMKEGGAERQRAVSLDLSRAAFNGAKLWFECSDEVLVRQDSDVPLARVTTVHQFLWNKDEVLHAQRHDKLTDKLGKAGEIAPLDCVWSDLGVHDDAMTFAFMEFEERFSQVSSAECEYLAQSLQQYYNQARLQSDSR
jgi:hypothetical protein